MARCICNARYIGPRSRGRNIVRATRYVTRTREHGDREAGERREQAPPTWGDRDRLIDAVREREKEGRRSHYVSLVISPERGRDLTERDFEELCKPWMENRAGRTVPYLAALHRDSDHPHLHVLAARDKYSASELQERKHETYALLRERERFADLRRELGWPLEQGWQREPEWGREHQELETELERRR